MLGTPRTRNPTEENWLYFVCCVPGTCTHWLPLSMCGMNKQVISVTRGFSQSLSQTPGRDPMFNPQEVSGCDS